MIPKLKAIISVIIGFIVGVIGSYLLGKKRGKNEEKAASMEKIIEVSNEVKKQNDKIDMLDNDNVRERLREYTHD